jgi:hypothetical protein
MKRILIMLALCIGAAFAQPNPNALRVWFADGTGLEISTESTGATAPRSTVGSENVAEGYDYHRLVTAKDQVLLGYDIEARKNVQGAFTIRIKPTNRDQVAIGGRGKWLEIPSIVAVREFPPLHAGDAVQVDILYNPASKERIYDVLKVLEPRQPSRMPSPVATERFTFDGVKIAADGKVIGTNPLASMRCGAMRIHLPERGNFYLAFAPSPDYPFQPAGWVDHSVLRFHAGTELIEITGKGNMLQKSDFGTFWVYSPDSINGASPDRIKQELADKRRTYGPNHPEIRRLETLLAAMDSALEFHCADYLEQLLPRK